MPAHGIIHMSVVGSGDGCQSLSLPVARLPIVLKLWARLPSDVYMAVADVREYAQKSIFSYKNITSPLPSREEYLSPAMAGGIKLANESDSDLGCVCAM